ncbi:MAG TPA: ECF-type sigma factor [Tahibacter sp.]|uniref:ECF-type sigma factor n=1 Tax=Tahibacter sp. TaxID=2056211 RepID=UPI002B58D963|nr:ECF-type sigma factor [Tahibacter sp.]HSX60914.1 ECF-type sigma factor [Tahibacter sp.]
MDEDFLALLERCRNGEAHAQHALAALVYADLKHIARRHLKRGRWINTLDTTSLLHESYLRLGNAAELPLASRAHLLNVASRAMRRVVCDHARRRLRRQDPLPVLLDDDAALFDEARRITALDDALRDLARVEPRQASVVECRFFTGLSLSETALALDVSERTVERDWADARRWLAMQLAAA